MYVICEVYFVFNGYRLQQQYVVYGIYVSGGVSDFLRVLIYMTANIFV